VLNVLELKLMQFNKWCFVIWLPTMNSTMRWLMMMQRKCTRNTILWQYYIISSFLTNQVMMICLALNSYRIILKRSFQLWSLIFTLQVYWYSALLYCCGVFLNVFVFWISGKTCCCWQTYSYFKNSSVASTPNSFGNSSQYLA